MSIVERSPAATPVRLQYESYPYPFRDPNDDKHRLLGTLLDNLISIQHYCYRGRKNFLKNFRVLVAGGGTGDSLVYLTNQLQHTDAEIVYIDLSTASREIARQRIHHHKLDHKVTWIHDSLLNLPKLGLEPFDYINCSGVLHHLPDPDEGLAALRAVLKDDGAMGLMVYGQYGRTGVYQMQDLMRLINQGEGDMHTKVQNTKAIIDRLPDSNWLKRQLHYIAAESKHDIGIYDLFLHSQDRAYTVPQLYEFLGKAGLKMIEFIHEMRVLYDPLMVLRGTPLLEVVQRLPKPQQQAIAELYYGNHTKHEFWASPQSDTVADFLDGEMIPQFNQEAVKRFIDDEFDSLPAEEGIKKTILATEGDNWPFQLTYTDGIQVTRRLRLDKPARKLIELIDGRRTLDQIVELLIAECTSPPKTVDVRNFCASAMELLRGYDLVMLRHRTAPEIVDMEVVQPAWKKKKTPRKPHRS